MISPCHLLVKAAFSSLSVLVALSLSLLLYGDAFTPPTPSTPSTFNVATELFYVHSSVSMGSQSLHTAPPLPPLPIDELQPQLSDSKAPPKWVPMELIESITEDLQISQHDFLSPFSGFVDVEAYTSCDDEGDDLHECDFFGQYLGPTKWLHLTPAAHQSIHPIHFDIWKEVWSHPSGMVDVAEKVSRETLRYYQEFMLEPETGTSATSDNDPSDPLVRVKVVPASFGLEGFEDAIWEATEDLMLHCGKDEAALSDSCSPSTSRCKAITFVVAAPDLMDPILTERDVKSYKSPQAEFDEDGFREFAAMLVEKLRIVSEIEPLGDVVDLTPFHPMWRSEEAGKAIEHLQASGWLQRRVPTSKKTETISISLRSFVY